MGDKIPEFESADKKGSTDTFEGTVGTSWTAIPNPAGGDIQEFSAHHEINDSSGVLDKYFEVSLDGGTTSLGKVFEAGQITGIIKNTQTQIHLKGNVASVPYKVVLSREPV